ncbi:energy transducer TonB [Xiashengella succiniciproducens]|jgi:TonB family protein|uniref:TonB family protein n=1 Tax=Xiashengella succiniciproducens TaxID=2949635 RepID=A0A9J6ZT06_9BACT|nr:TonB family protein [Alkaliflexus sp. Ai-910]MDI9538591.1 TonB family protein [Bacteroidota bacterium]URW80691.1 TonB family protein [Alkaliflexus sp. Ai-910]HHT99948.1 TonB family protein [Bacteroidales bacterium]
MRKIFITSSKIAIALLSVALLPAFVMAENPNSVVNDSVYTVVDKAPKFNGKPSRIDRFIRENLIYPDDAWMEGIEGVVTVSFVVTREGQLMDAKIESGVEPLLDMEALRVVELMQSWTPAKKNGQLVHSRMVVPVSFSLTEDEKAFAETLINHGLEKNPPLFVLDNKIVRSRVHLPSYNVQSIRVLKGEEAVKRFGEEGKNGVVIITTKRGTPPIR